MRCLIIDDDPDARSLVERLLVTRGFRATAVPNARAALAMVSEKVGEFDVVLVDMGMPDMTGAQVIMALRDRDPRLRLLVVSGFDDQKHILEAIEAGADGYLLKDELGERLPGAIQDVFAGKSPLSSRAGSVLLQQVAKLRRRQEVKLANISPLPITIEMEAMDPEESEQLPRSGEIVSDVALRQS